jgi:hypothetical protein
MSTTPGKAKTVSSMIAYHHAHPGHFRKIPAGQECKTLWLDAHKGIAVATFPDGRQAIATIEAFAFQIR